LHFLLGFLLVFCIISDAASVSCPSGYTDITSLYESTFQYKYDGRCPSGYETYNAPDDVFTFYFSGRRDATGPETCAFGTRRVSGVCTAYTSDGCPDDDPNITYNRITGYDATFSHQEADGSTCPSGYVSYDAPDIMWFKFEGTRVPNPPTLCATGYYVNGTCTARPQGSCPTGYYDSGFDDAFAAYAAGGACPSGYANSETVASCTSYVTSSLCTTLCDTGMSHTSAGECAAPCGISGVSTLHVGATATFPAWGTKTTTHALAISDGTDMCYVNLTTGSASDALKYQYGNTVYHTTD
jgi:hypothetical protein